MRRFIKVLFSHVAYEEFNVLILEQSHRCNEFIDADSWKVSSKRVNKLMQSARLRQSPAENSLHIDIKRAGGPICTVWITSCGGIQINDIAFYTRGSVLASDTQIEPVYDVKTLIRVATMVCVYNQYHSHNAMTLEDHWDNIRLSHEQRTCWDTLKDYMKEELLQ